MKRTVATVLACIAALATGCGTSDSSGDPEAKATATSATTVSKDGVYAVGKDIKPGVYTAKGECVAYSATPADFDIMNDDGDPDDYLAGAMPVGDLQRIELHQGEFFTTRSCSTWTLEDGTKSASVDPASVAGACEILVGKDHAVQDALEFPKDKETAADEQRRGEIQDRLFTVVVANTKGLADPAGQLVDFLDDPDEYIENGKPVALITDAVSRIRSTCKNG